MRVEVCKHCGEIKGRHQEGTLLCPQDGPASEYGVKYYGPKEWASIESQKKEAQELYSLGLHEWGRTEYGDILRVPGGWIYTTGETSVFVPYHNEFQD